MQISVEQIEHDISAVDADLKQIEALMNQRMGALSVLKNMLEYLKKEPEYPKSDFISDVNKDIQARDTALAEVYQAAQPNLDIDYPETYEEEQG